MYSSNKDTEALSSTMIHVDIADRIGNDFLSNLEKEFGLPSTFNAPTVLSSGKERTLSRKGTAMTKDHLYGPEVVSGTSFEPTSKLSEGEIENSKG